MSTGGPAWAAFFVRRTRTADLLSVATLLVIMALLFGACGGSRDSTSSPGPAAMVAMSPGDAGSTGTAGATDAVPAASSGEATPAPGVDLAKLADLSGLQSFRWEISLNGSGAFLSEAGIQTVPRGNTSALSAHGAYISPDQAQVAVSASGLEYEQTIKGDKQWTTVAGVTTGPTPATSDASSLIYVSSFVDQESLIDPSSLDCGASEVVNGVEAVRCETNPAANRQIVRSLVGSDAETTDASFVIWVAKDGNYIVQWQFDVTGTAGGEPFQWSFLANITDVNSVSSIEPWGGR